MEIGIDSFASLENPLDHSAQHRHQSMQDLLERIKLADDCGLSAYGIGEHHRPEYLDSAAHNILSAAAAITNNIILTSAVAILSATDPVRLYQNYATLDLISKGRASMVVGRASFQEAFPLFGLRFEDYDALYDEKLKLLLEIQKNEFVHWKGQFRPELTGQGVYPRPYQDKIPIWVGVGGTPQSVVRAAQLRLPLMIAIIGGETHRFAPLTNLYRQTWLEMGFPQEEIRIGIHSLGYVQKDSKTASEDFFPGYARSFNRIGKERGWGPITRESYEYVNGYTGALVVGEANEVADKILRHSESLGGINRFMFQMSVAELNHKQLCQSIELIGSKVIPQLRNA